MFRRLITIICTLSLISFFVGSTANASTVYGFVTTKISQDDKDQIWQNLKIETHSESIVLSDFTSPIVSFDVNKNGNILLGLKDSKVVILDRSENLLNIFTFSDNGTFCVQWNEENILLLFVRGSIIVELSLSGQLIDIIETDDSSIQNNSKWNEIIKKTQVYIGDTSYYVRNRMGFLNAFSADYSQLIKTDADGSETILYDVSESQLTKAITIIIIVAIIVTILLMRVIRESKNIGVDRTGDGSMIES